MSEGFETGAYARPPHDLTENLGGSDRLLFPHGPPIASAGIPWGGQVSNLPSVMLEPMDEKTESPACYVSGSRGISAKGPRPTFPLTQGTRLLDTRVGSSRHKLTW